MKRIFKRACCLYGWLMMAAGLHAQDNYEIQVYGSETMLPGATMVELHSNYIFAGSRQVQNGVLPTHHVLHETVEITHGFTPWLEVGFYFFNTLGSEGRSNYVGSHIRPRVRIPESWQWPVGLSLSLESGLQKTAYSEDAWTVEIRPILDKKLGRYYLAFNPTFDKSLRGLNSRQGFVFSPNIKASADVSAKVALGMEYYGSMGAFLHFLPLQQGQHQLFLAADLNFSEDWEVNLGYGLGLTKYSETGIVKLILGYRLRHRKG